MMTYSLDANHTEIVEAFEKLGCKVVDNAKVKRHEPNQLDVWVGFPNPLGGLGMWVWVEIKTPDGKLRPGQQEMIAVCENMALPVEVVRNTRDVERVWQKYQTW